MSKILGLDLGTNSIGWAVVEKNIGEKFKLIEKGVRIFQEGVKIEKGIEGSKAAERSGYRSARRIKFRRKLRKISTLKALSEFGYCPRITDEELNNWRYKKSYPQNVQLREWMLTDEKENNTPYYFRSHAITEKLDLSKKENRFEIGRAFYHICQRRGFLSNRLEGTKESDGEVKKSIAEISEAKGDKTLGQYFYEKYKRKEKIRDIYTHREEHYLDEFNRICAFQRLPAEFIEKLRKAIFYQRPLKSQKGLIGKCVFETNKQRCAISRPEFEEYRMLCFINNIKIKTPEDEKLRFLNEEEKNIIRPQFFRKSKEHFDFEDIAKQLAPQKQYKYYRARNVNPEDWLFNYSIKTTVSGCPVSAQLMGLFGGDFMNVRFNYIREKDGKESTIDINDIWHVIFTFNSEEKLTEFAKERLNFDDGQISQFLKIRLKQDYASLSLKAIRKILPYLRVGLIYSHAVFLANMDEVIPKEIWKDKVNQELIQSEVNTIIQTQNEEKQIVDIVNGIIKNSRDENGTWSDEAVDIYKTELHNKIESYFGKNRFATFSEEKKSRLVTNALDLLKQQMQKNMGQGEFAQVRRIDERVKDFVTDNFEVDESLLDNLYHPSALEVYKPPVKGKDGRLYLSSPLISSIRNPMAMRSLHQLRGVINKLIKSEIIDANTKVHIEMARGLMNANERKAIKSWQNDIENKHKIFASKIKEHLGGIVEPTKEEILKYQLWEEQNHKCLYTGKEIGLADFIGPNPKYDIEHTIPRSQSFDNSQVNKTLCESKFNRAVKKNRIPYELENHEEILMRIEQWKEKFEELEKQINIAVRQSSSATDKEAKDRAIQKRHKLSYVRNYWKNKYYRFEMKNVPEGFKNSQLVDTGIITKYSRLYLKTFFDKVYTVKGNTVSDFRKMWGLQENYKKKERVNHIHHCIDAITIACITKESYENLAKFYHDWEELHIKGIDQLPRVDKPWVTFTEDVKNVENEVLVSHYTPDILPKQAKKKLRKRGEIQYNKHGEPIYQHGDTVRGSLHQDAIYGAIKHENSIVYVKRKPLQYDNQGTNGFKEFKQLEKIVDEVVRSTIKNQINLKIQEGKSFKEAISEDIWMNVAKGIKINKVRCITNIKNPLKWNKKNRDLSINCRHKHSVHVVNDGNYLMAIYEGKDTKGKKKRDFKIVNNLEAGEFFKYSVQSVLKKQGLSNIDKLLPRKIITGKVEVKFKAFVKTGSLVVFWENDPMEIWELPEVKTRNRLYKVTKQNKDGRLTFKFHQEARNDDMLRTDYKQLFGEKPPKSLTNGESKVNFKIPAPKLLLSPANFNMLIQGFDFELTPLGEIIKLEDYHA